MSTALLHTNANYSLARKFTGRALLIALLAMTYWMLGCQGNAAAADEAPRLSTVHLEPFVVNLADNDGKSFLRVGIDLSVESAPSKTKGAAHSTESVAVMRDSIISLLSTCKAEDLLTPDGKKKLKQELSKALNERLPEQKVKEVYFNEFMVQH